MSIFRHEKHNKAFMSMFLVSLKGYLSYKPRISTNLLFNSFYNIEYFLHRYISPFKAAIIAQNMKIAVEVQNSQDI